MFGDSKKSFMANLEQIKYFNEKFGKSSPLTSKKVLFSINESLDPDNLKKAISASIAELGSDFADYLDKGESVDAALLFIDITNFSTKQSTLSGDDLSAFFDEYYDLIIPIIYKYGGEIDKIMGDGIICLFAPPFLTDSPEERRLKANACGEEIVSVTKNSKFASKVAVHSGMIKYFKNKSGFYKEFTIIGKPLTELFRLESISNDSCINFYEECDIHDLHKDDIQLNTWLRLAMGNSSLGQYSYQTIIGLKGVTFKGFYSKEL